MKWGLLLASAVALAACPVSGSEGASAPLAALAQADAKLGQVADRLLMANAALCRQTMPVTGMILHSRDQYANPPESWFVNGSVAVQQVLHGSAAEAAGLMAGDGLVRIEEQPLASWPDEAGRPRRDAAFALLAQQAPADPLAIAVNRGEEELVLTLRPAVGCRAMVEVITSEANLARADGRVIQVSGDLVTELDEAQLAVLVAHELGHAVLEHRRRLSVAGVQQGIAGLFGRNRRLGRQAEMEADRLSPHLLANAGYDPQIAVQFWQSAVGERVGGGALRSPVYPPPAERARLIAGEIADHLVDRTRPSNPSHLLAGRDEPLAE